MRYITMDVRKDDTGDVFTEEFNEKGAAITKAELWWSRLTSREQKEREITVIESVNPDEEAEDHFDGNVAWSSADQKGDEGANETDDRQESKGGNKR